MNKKFSYNITPYSVIGKITKSSQKKLNKLIADIKENEIKKIYMTKESWDKFMGPGSFAQGVYWGNIEVEIVDDDIEVGMGVAMFINGKIKIIELD